jgi:hypothetical protein
MRVLPYWPKHRYLELAPKYWQATRGNLNPVELEATSAPSPSRPPHSTSLAEAAHEARPRGHKDGCRAADTKDGAVVRVCATRRWPRTADARSQITPGARLSVGGKAQKLRPRRWLTVARHI